MFGVSGLLRTGRESSLKRSHHLTRKRCSLGYVLLPVVEMWYQKFWASIEFLVILPPGFHDPTHCYLQWFPVGGGGPQVTSLIVASTTLSIFASTHQCFYFDPWRSTFDLGRNLKMKFDPGISNKVNFFEWVCRPWIIISAVFQFWERFSKQIQLIYTLRSKKSPPAARISDTVTVMLFLLLGLAAVRPRKNLGMQKLTLVKNQEKNTATHISIQNHV